MRITTITVIVAVLAVAMLAVSGPGTRLGWWHFRVGLLLFAGSAVVALVAVILAGFTWKQNRFVAAGSGLVALGVVVFVGASLAGARGKPMIHDISTDLDDPPRFDAVMPLRGATSNPANNIDPNVAEQQRRAYPDVAPAVIDAPPAVAFQRVRSAAESLGWEIVAADESAGRIEATDTTRWFGFKDDVVVRIRPANGGSRIDVRSTSRVGRSDVGVNAARIRELLARVGDGAAR